MNLFKLFIFLVIIGVFLSIITSCANRTKHYSSSVVQYLYPDQKEPIERPEIPSLSLPLKVGIAFVPETSGVLKNITEKDKMNLMKEVSEHFKKYDFVESIELIPSAYLRPKGSFTNLDQIRTMFGTDVIALLSYDQTQFTDEGLASITYWTIIGAYIIPGEKNDTHTMVDAAVYDIKSKKLLFRAPGVSHIKSKATPVNLSEQNRLDSLAGFKVASNDLVINLEEQLGLFKQKVKESPQDFKVAHKPGHTGGGSLDLIFLLIISTFLGLRVWKLKKNKA